MNILPLLLDIGFTKYHEDGNNLYLMRPYVNAFGEDDNELFDYSRCTDGSYSLTLQRTNFVPIRIEIKEENEKLVYDFISNHFGKEYVRDFKLKKIL